MSEPQSESAKILNSTSSGEYEALMSEAAVRIRSHLEGRSQPATNSAAGDLEARVAAINLDSPGIGPSGTLREIDELFLAEAVWFHHPHYMAHLNCPVEITAVAAEAMLAAVNTSMDTYDQSRIGTFIERHVVDWIGKRVGFSSCDGVFTSGGTQSNMQALLLAREAALGVLPQVSRAVSQSRQVVFTSEESHFSVEKAAMVLGLGADAAVKVPVDHEGRIRPEALDEAIRRSKSTGFQPMAVVATAGTTDRGIIDPLIDVADVTDDHGVWLHVDAAYGGGLLVSATRRSMLEGIERARSVTVDFHKMFFQPITCSVLVIQYPQDLRGSEWHADYLNPEGAQEPNQVDKSLQTTRPFDALKLYATLRSTGVDGLGRSIDQVLDLTEKAHAFITEHPDLQLCSSTDLSTVLFRWQPQGVDPDTAAAMVSGIRDTMQRNGKAMIAKTVLAGLPCLKLTLLNPATTLADVRAVLEDVADVAESLHRDHQVKPAPEEVAV